MTWEVYALCEPGTGEVRYIGVTRKGVKARAASHASYPSSKPMRAWVAKLRARKKTPAVKVLVPGIADRGEAIKTEGAMIRDGFARGLRLLNIKHSPGVLPRTKALSAAESIASKIRRAERRVKTAERNLAAAAARVEMLRGRLEEETGERR